MTKKGPRMSEMRVAFYKAQKGDGWGNLIASWTGLFNWGEPKYCHCEIGFPNGMWFSSASRNYDGTSGTRWISEENLFKHPDRWDVYKIRCDRSISDMVDACEKELGKKYDWLGIAGVVSIFGQINNKDRWYCSEICYYVLFGKWKKRTSPVYLYREIKKMIGD